MVSLSNHELAAVRRPHREAMGDTTSSAISSSMLSLTSFLAPCKKRRRRVVQNGADSRAGDAGKPPGPGHLEHAVGKGDVHHRADAANEKKRDKTSEHAPAVQAPV